MKFICEKIKFINFYLCWEIMIMVVMYHTVNNVRYLNSWDVVSLSCFRNRSASPGKLDASCQHFPSEPRCIIEPEVLATEHEHQHLRLVRLGDSTSHNSIFLSRQISQPSSQPASRTRPNLYWAQQAFFSHQLQWTWAAGLGWRPSDILRRRKRTTQTTWA